MRATHLSLLVLVAAHAAQGDLNVNIGSRRFHVSDAFVDWESANADCKDKGMELASIMNEQDHFRLKKALGSRQDDSFWVGATDRGSPGVWSWTGEPGNGFVTKWAQGEPDLIGSEQCVEVRPVDRLWNNRKCSLRKKYVCEDYIQITTPAVPSNSGSSSESEEDDKDFKFKN